MCGTCKLSSLGLGTKDAGVFCRSQWKFPWVCWFLYRLLWTIYYVGFMGFLLIATLITQPLAAAYFFIYLTDWTALVFTVYLVVAFLNVLIDRKHGNSYHSLVESDDVIIVVLSWRHKLQWLLMNIYVNVSILVTVVYWSFLRVDTIPIIVDLTLHTFPCIVGILGVFLTPVPVKIQHVIYPLGYGISYIVFTLIYWGAGGLDPNGNTGIYPGLLDWAVPGTTMITIAASCGAVVVSQVALWGIYRCKMALMKRWLSTRPTAIISMDTTMPEGAVMDENENGDGRDELEKANFYDNLTLTVEDGMALPDLSSKQSK